MQLILVLVSLCFGGCAPLSQRAPAASPVEALALVGGTIHVSPTAEPIRDGVVVIERGVIVAVGPRPSVEVPADAQLLDCTGLTITAGFWNSHVHFFERKWMDVPDIPADELDQQLAETFTRFGFTSVFDLTSFWENTRSLRDRIQSGEVAGPSILSTGEGLVAPGVVPAQSVLSVMGFMPTPLPEIVDADQAADKAKALLADGVDGIKLFASRPHLTPLSREAMDAAVREARRAGKPVFAHPNTAADVLAAVQAGADVIVHTTPRDGPWAGELIAAMKAAGIALTPTLTLWQHSMRHDRRSTREHLVATARDQLGAWIAAEGTVLFGTDLGAVDDDPSDEYALMHAAGMDFHQILASLTTAPAERFGASADSGRVATGLAADLVVLRGDPSVDVGALTAVQYTLRNGQIIYRAQP